MMRGTGTPDSFIWDSTSPEVTDLQISIDYESLYVNGWIGFMGSARVDDSLSGIDTSTCQYTINGTDWLAGSYLRRTWRCMFTVPGRALSDQQELQIQVRVTDQVGNTGYSEILERTADAALPTAGVEIDGDFQGPNSPVPFIKGWAEDTVSDVSNVMITIRRDSDNRYFAGRMWGMEIWSWMPRMHSVNGTTAWSKLAGLPDWENGVRYTVRPYAWDQVHAMMGSGSSDSFTWDSQAPADPDTFESSHTVDAFSNLMTITVDFSGAHDYGLSGVAGYYYNFANQSETPDITTATYLAHDPDDNHQVVSDELGEGEWWFNLRTIDNVGNITSTVNLGPFFIDLTDPEFDSELLVSGDIFYEGDLIPTETAISMNDEQGIDYLEVHGPSLGFYWEQIPAGGVTTWALGLNEIFAVVYPGLTRFDTSVLNEGDHEVTYTLVDLASNSVSTTVTYTLLNVPPQVQLEQDQTIDEGQAAIFTGRFADPSFISADDGGNLGDPDDANWLVEIDYGLGNGFESLGEVPQPGEIVVPDQVYPEAGDYTATLRVTENSFCEILPPMFDLVSVQHVTDELEVFETPRKRTCGEGEVGQASVMVTVLDVVPTVVVSASPAEEVILPDTITLTALVEGGNTPYQSTQWSGDCTGEDVEFILPAMAGEYTCAYTVVDYDGDMATDEITVTIVQDIISWDPDKTSDAVYTEETGAERTLLPTDPLNPGLASNLVAYQLRLTYTGNTPVTATTVVDNPDSALLYVAGTSYLGGVLIADPTLSTDGTMTWNLSGLTVQPDDVLILNYQMQVAAGTAPGVYCNLVTTTDQETASSCVLVGAVGGASVVVGRPDETATPDDEDEPAAEEEIAEGEVLGATTQSVVLGALASVGNDLPTVLALLLGLMSLYLGIAMRKKKEV